MINWVQMGNYLINSLSGMFLLALIVGVVFRFADGVPKSWMEKAFLVCVAMGAMMKLYPLTQAEVVGWDSLIFQLGLAGWTVLAVYEYLNRHPYVVKRKRFDIDQMLDDLKKGPLTVENTRIELMPRRPTDLGDMVARLRVEALEDAFFHPHRHKYDEKMISERGEFIVSGRVIERKVLLMQDAWHYVEMRKGAVMISELYRVD